MTKSKTVELRYIGYLHHYEREAHVDPKTGKVDRPPTPNEIYACTTRIVDDLHLRGVTQEPVTFNFANNFTATVNREAAEWLIEHEGSDDWEIVGEESYDEEIPLGSEG